MLQGHQSYELDDRPPLTINSPMLLVAANDGDHVQKRTCLSGEGVRCAIVQLDADFAQNELGASFSGLMGQMQGDGIGPGLWARAAGADLRGIALQMAECRIEARCAVSTWPGKRSNSRPRLWTRSSTSARCGLRACHRERSSKFARRMLCCSRRRAIHRRWGNSPGTRPQCHQADRGRQRVIEHSRRPSPLIRQPAGYRACGSSRSSSAPTPGPSSARLRSTSPSASPDRE